MIIIIIIVIYTIYIYTYYYYYIYIYIYIIIHIYYKKKKNICTWCISYGDSPLNLCLGPKAPEGSVVASSASRWLILGPQRDYQLSKMASCPGVEMTSELALRSVGFSKDLEFCSEWTGKVLKPGLACCNFSLNGLLRSHNLFYQ